MIAHRWVATSTWSWTLAVVLLMAGAIWMATSVESISQPDMLMSALLSVPGIVAPLAPTACALGAALAAAHMQSHGESSGCRSAA